MSETPTHHLDHVNTTNALIHALNLLSRNLPLPSDLLHSVSSLYLHGSGSEIVSSVDEDDAVRNLGDLGLRCCFEI